eukprot:TRINITY_DN2828_c0_g1_i1.p2 TRINITY_DN2828_c0_g1~~TRINITY_DN2828_c0_g1_i1.p2  ORF type:complete len:264 (+),score=88.97 TRINITY_DN2828_c0_g1_i1:120-911(+)
MCIRDRVSTQSTWGSTRSNAFKAIAVEIIAMGLWYNPRLALVLLEQKDALQFFFESWYTLLPSFKYDFNKKRILLGLASLLHIPIQELPQLIINALQNLMREMFKLTSQILEIREKDQSSQDEEALEVPDAEGANQGDWKNGTSPFMDKDEYKKLQVAKLAAADDEDEMEDDDEDDEDFEEENGILSGGGALLYDSPIEKLDEIAFLSETLEALKATPEVYEQLLTALSPEDRVQLYRNFEIAHEQQVERARKIAEEQASTSA